MAEEIAFENGRISNFQGLVTLTLDWVILHTSCIEIEENFCGRTDGRAFNTSFIRLTQNSRPKNGAV